MSQRVEPSTLVDTFPDPEAASNVLYNPSFEQLRDHARHEETPTEYGSPRYISEQKSRSADRTKNLVDDEFSGEDWDAIREAVSAFDSREFVCLDRRVGRNPDSSYTPGRDSVTCQDTISTSPDRDSPDLCRDDSAESPPGVYTCRLFVPRSYARIALAWGKLLEPAQCEPAFQTLQLPDWDEPRGRQRRIRVLPDTGLTFVLGSDYTGEAKKSFLRLYMYRTKQQGGLGIHAGSKRVTIERDGDLETVGQAFLGLSATGKSTLTGHGCWLDDSEGAEMLQDDVCALTADGAVHGSEGGGLYIKTDGLDGDEQPALYHTATHESAVLENVTVDSDGTVDFDDTELTCNGRAVIRREHLDSAADDIDMADVDQVFFITRNPMMPPVAKLSDRQAGVAFMLGESIQTSAGDPDAAGESIRVVGTNPFIIGLEGEEGNRFYDLVSSNDCDCYLLNTGHVGPAKTDIGVHESVQILVSIARDEVAWQYDGTLGMELPAELPRLDLNAFYPPDHYDDFEAELANLRAERWAYLAQFEHLDRAITDAVY